MNRDEEDAMLDMPFAYADVGDTLVLDLDVLNDQKGKKASSAELLTSLHD